MDLSRRARIGVGVALAALVFTLAGAGRASAAAPDFGPNVIVFSPSMAQSTIQSTLDAISTQQVPSEFGTGRYALLFEPGTYGSAANPLDFQVGYYTQVAGLGASPSDVVINGAINVFNRCFGGGVCNGLTNFWRSMSNLTLNVDLPSSPPNYAPYSGDAFSAFCDNTAEMWAVSQAAPISATTRSVAAASPRPRPATLIIGMYEKSLASAAIDRLRSFS